MSLFDYRFNMSQNASPSKLNFRFVDSPIVFYWEGHNTSMQSEIDVNEHLMESLFDKISNRSSPTSMSHQKGLQIIIIFLSLFLPRATSSSWACFSSLGAWPKWEHAPKIRRTHQGNPWKSSSLTTTLEGQQVCSSQVRGPIYIKLKSISDSRSIL